MVLAARTAKAECPRKILRYHKTVQICHSRSWSLLSGIRVLNIGVQSLAVEQVETETRINTVLDQILSAVICMKLEKHGFISSTSQVTRLVFPKYAAVLPLPALLPLAKHHAAPRSTADSWIFLTGLPKSTTIWLD